MKRQITADRPTKIRGVRSPRGIESEMTELTDFMIRQMAQRFQNQVLNKIQVSTVEKFADFDVVVMRERKVLDHVVEEPGFIVDEVSFTDADGNQWFRDERVPTINRREVMRTERYQHRTTAHDVRMTDEIISFTDAQTGNFAAILLRLAKSAKRSLLKQFSNGRIEAISQKVLAKLDRKAKQEFYERVAGKTGINVQDLIAKEGMKATTNALMLETAQWIQTLRDDTFQKFTNNTLFAMSQGESLDTIVKQFDDIVVERKNHARFLARNQVQNYNSITTKIRAQNLGITKAIWETAEDDRVRPSHAQRHGKEFDLAKGLYSSIDGLHLIPGTDYNCFPGDSQLNHTSFVHKLYRRLYSGELLSFVFDDGVILKTTPNHPVLTANGFKPAHLINAGDDVVRRLDQGIDTAELYGNRPIPTFEQIYAALDLLGVEHGVAPAISGKFHGDVSDGEVEVVAFDGVLMREADASIREKLGELSFSVADQVVVLACLTCNRDAMAMLVGLGLSPDRIMRTLDLCRTLLSTHLTPLECFRFALGAWGDSLLDKTATNDVTTDSKLYSDCVFAFAVLVHGRDLLVGKLDSVRLDGHPGVGNAGLLKVSPQLGVTNPGLLAGRRDAKAASYQLCRVVEKSGADFLGHIYNLQTDTGDYITNTTAVSNCRCTAIYVIPETHEE